MDYVPSQAVLNTQFSAALATLDHAVGELFKAMSEPEALLEEFREHLAELREAAAQIKGEVFDRIAALEADGRNDPARVETGPAAGEEARLVTSPGAENPVRGHRVNGARRRLGPVRSFQAP